MGWPHKSLVWLACGVAVVGYGPAVFEPNLLAGPAESESARLNAELALLESTSRVFESVAELVAPAAVYVEARVRSRDGGVISEESGSGVLIRPEGRDRPMVLTNVHVIAGAETDDVEIHLADGRALSPKRVWTDPQTDVALLDPGVEDLPAAKMGDSDSVRIGQWVLAIGSPFGLNQSVTHGIISAKERRNLGLPGDLRIKEFLQTDAPINPGNSGGPLVNLHGEVIGINTAIASKTGANSGVAFSIPINMAKWVAGELLAHGKVRRAYLGISFPVRFDAEHASRLGLPLPRGALVSMIHEQSPARAAGFKTDDVILSFNGKQIVDENHLINVVGVTPVGKRVEVVVWRNHKRRKLEVVLGSWDAYESRAEPRSPSKDRHFGSR